MPKPTRTDLSATELHQVTGGFYARGGAGDDALTGSQAADTLAGFEGNDTINGQAGNDYIAGAGGNDQINAGDGNDWAFGNDGNDALQGGNGADYLGGDAGDDTIIGGWRDFANDTAIGGQGNDEFWWGAGSGNDSFIGGEGRDTLWLEGMGPAYFMNYMTLDGGADLTMHVSENQTVSFTHTATGLPVGVSGSFTLHGETLRFSDVENFRFFRFG